MATEYMVFEGNSGKWALIGKAKAASSKAAIAAVLKESDQQDGEFVAVPARSWKPVSVAVETALKFS